ncbi:MAG: recombinase A [Myxococcales bacterium]|nr:recombinase A [Myxococcales bacterium]
MSSYLDAKDFVDRARARSSAAAAARVISLDDVRAASASPAGPRWQLDDLTGRLTELSGVGAVASLTAATALLLEAQGRGEPCAWIVLPGACFFPPDLADSGVDLDALVVVRTRDTLTLARAADTLLRSGSFGLIVLELGAAGELPTATQGRLVSLAQRHDAALIAITERSRDAASLGSIVSLRAEAVRERVRGGGFQVAVRALKDKRRGPGWSQAVAVVPPAGLR